MCTARGSSHGPHVAVVAECFAFVVVVSLNLNSHLWPVDSSQTRVCSVIDLRSSLQHQVLPAPNQSTCIVLMQERRRHVRGMHEMDIFKDRRL